MKKLLVLGNCILTLLLGWSVWAAWIAPEKAELQVGKKKNSRSSAAEEKKVAVPAPVKLNLPKAAEAVEIIVRKNVFDPQRSGGLAGGRGVVSYQLVGIYRVKDSQGAIILSKGAGRNRNTMPVKQYYRIGDTLPNGYALSKISDNQAVFTRGGSRMTLDMAVASENFAAGNVRRRTPNHMQQMVDLMRQSLGMQYRQQMNMMQMMRNNQNNTPARSGSTNSRSRSRTR